MVAFLARYRAAGGKLCVVSHSLSGNIRRDYRENGLPEPDLIFGWDAPPEQRKPNAYPLREIMRQLALPPSALLMVDDLRHGYTMAKSCGVAFARGGLGVCTCADRNVYARPLRCLSAVCCGAGAICSAGVTGLLCLLAAGGASCRRGCGKKGGEAAVREWLPRNLRPRSLSASVWALPSVCCGKATNSGHLYLRADVRPSGDGPERPAGAAAAAGHPALRADGGPHRLFTWADGPGAACPISRWRWRGRC